MAVGPVFTALSVLLLPGAPLVPFDEASSVSDTWSISITDSGSVADTLTKAGTDTWSVSLADSGSVNTDAGTDYTELGTILLPWTVNVYLAKAQDATAPIATSENWSLTWTEDATDTTYIDTWDIWAVSWQEAPLSVQVFQTFVATDNWNLSWADVGSVFSGAPVSITPSDTWSLSIADSSLVAATVSASADTWSITISDSGSVTVTQDAKSGSDTWSLQLSNETGFFSILTETPILTSDEWKITFQETTAIFAAYQRGHRGRRVRPHHRRRTTPHE